MKRTTSKLRRFFLNALTAMSLLLALATAGLWWHGVVDSPRFTYYASPLEQSNPTYTLYWRDGAIGMSGSRVEYLSTAKFREGQVVPSGYSNFEPFMRPHHFFPPGGGFRLQRSVYNFSPDLAVRIRYWEIGVPLWLPLIICLVLPGVRALASLAKRHRPGHCPSCGYDTRANPARCSECGHEIAEPSAAQLVAEPEKQ